MRFCYFVPGALSCGPLGHAELERRAAYLGAHASGARVEIREAADGPASIESAIEEQQGAWALVRAVPELQAAGFEAVILGCFGDPGLAAARELVEIPVVGPAQASIHLAAQLGDRFGILTVVQEVIPGLRRLVRAYGQEGLLATLRAVEVPVLELRQDRARLLQRLAAEGEAALADGADVLILGCMTMGFMDLAKELQERLRVPVINPVLAALKLTETLAGCGLAPSRRTYPSPRKLGKALSRS